MTEGKQKLSDWYVPADIAFFFGLYFIVIPVALLSGKLITLLSSARRSGDTTLLYSALAFGLVGTVLLFLARLPLYRQRRFFTFGPGALDKSHRKLYRWAYRFLGVSVLLLCLLLLALLQWFNIVTNSASRSICTPRARALSSQEPGLAKLIETAGRLHYVLALQCRR